MKTAVSLPDDVFRGAEKLARKLKVNRSELYYRALAEYLARHQPDEVTAALDRMCEELGKQDDSDFATIASKTILERTQW